MENVFLCTVQAVQLILTTNMLSFATLRLSYRVFFLTVSVISFTMRCRTLSCYPSCLLAQYSIFHFVVITSARVAAAIFIMDFVVCLHK